MSATSAATARVPSTRWYVWRFMLYRPGMWLVSTIGIILAAYVVPLLPGLLLREFFNVLTGDVPARFGVWALSALVLAAGVAQITSNFTTAIFENGINLLHAALVQRNVFERILELPAARAVPHSPGEALSRFRDDTMVVARFVAWMADPIGQLLLTVITVGILIRVSPLLTVAVFLPVALVLGLIEIGTGRIQRYRRANQEAIGGVTDLLGEIFGSVNAVKVAGAEDRVVDHLRVRNEVRRKAALAELLLTQLLNSATNNTTHLGTGLVLLLAGQSLKAGTFTVGDFALFVAYLGHISQFAGLVSELSRQYKQQLPSYTRLVELLRGAAKRSPGAGEEVGAERRRDVSGDPRQLVAHRPLHLRGQLPEVPRVAKTAADRLERLDVRGLTYCYPDRAGAGRRGIEGIDLTLVRGTLTVVTGRIGAGKTTLLRVLLGLLTKEAGEIRWNGRPVEDPATFFVPPRAAYVPQVPRLFSDSLRDNILLGLPEAEVDLAGALRLAVFEEDVRAMENGLETRVGPRGVRLSGGQVQRAAAARMFVREPELLVVDDLSSALDVETERRLWDGLAALGEQLSERPNVSGVREGVSGQGEWRPTVLAVSHREALLKRADQVIWLEDGVIPPET